jgi:hypothetical protein
MKYDVLFPMNNLKKINPIEAEHSSKAGLVKYGSNVPLNMEILERLDPLNYLLQMNGKKAFAESEKLLEPGMRYWGEAIHKRGEKFVIGNLIKQPQIFKQVQDNAFVDARKVLEAFSNNSRTPFETQFKQEIISQMAKSSDRNEFIFLNQLLLSMENNVITIPINYEDRSLMFQYKYGYSEKERREREELEANEIKTLDFYAIFETLGPMKGKIIYLNDQISLNIEVNFDKSKKFLERNIINNELVNNINVIIKVVKNEIQPLYSFTQNNLLDVRT